MAKIMILRSYDRYPRIGETLGEGMIVEIKNLKLNNYQYLNSKGFKVVAEKIEQITHDVCIICYEDTKMPCYLAKARKQQKHTRVILAQEELKLHMRVAELVDTEYEDKLMLVYGNNVVFKPTVYFPTDNLKPIYENLVYLDSDKTVIVADE